MTLAMTRQSCSGVDRIDDWKVCCASILGWNTDTVLNNKSGGVASGESSTKKSHRDVTIVNWIDWKTTSSSNVDKQQQQQPEKKKHHPVDDFWSEAIQEIQQNMNRMISWLEEKKWIYLLPQTSDQEVSLIQSTLSSFIITTANELETLRRHSTTNNTTSRNFHDTTQTQQQHDITVLQILSERLQECVAEPLAHLQKIRQRDAVQIWQNPLSCRFVPILDHSNNNNNLLHRHPPALLFSKTTKQPQDSMDQILGLDHDVPHHNLDQRRFLPKNPTHVWKQDFLEPYRHKNADPPPQKPVTFCSQQKIWKRQRSQNSLLTNDPPLPQQKENNMTTNEDNDDDEPLRKKINTKLVSDHNYNPQKKNQPLHPKPQSDPSHDAPEEEVDWFYQSVNPKELEQESQLLLAQHQQHDLDAVQKIETTMVEITTLLSQFSELVLTQQEDVLLIRDAAATSKQDISQGQEKLIQATESTQKSNHFMARIITTLALVLLFFHLIHP